MSNRERQDRIARYREGTEAFLAAVDGITDAELDRRLGDDEWTPREVVHHFADAEMRAAIRLRTLVAEDDPVIQAYDEKNYTKTLHYDRPIATSLDAAL